MDAFVLGQLSVIDPPSPVEGSGTQSAPPLLGAGLVQFLCRPLTAELEHEYSPQSDQCPFTSNIDMAFIDL